jgi:hypothetical protein
LPPFRVGRDASRLRLLREFPIDAFVKIVYAES